MTGAQWEILRPLADETVMALARARLLEGLKFFDGNRLIETHTRAVAKLALLIVRIMNPSEEFTNNEKDLMNCPARIRQEKVRAFKGTKRAKKGI